jgi:hypothetical protein
MRRPRSVTGVMLGEVAAESAPEAASWNGAVALEFVGERSFVGAEVSRAVWGVTHVAKSGDRGFSDRARRYAETAAEAWPDSAWSRDRTSHVVQFRGSSCVAWIAA